MHRMVVIALAIGFASVAPLACGDDTDEGDCVSLCEDAQGRDCTSITGDCGEFCGAVFSVEDRAGCADERLDYHECLNDEGVCSGSCSGSESALESCLGTYCLGHSGEDECQVLLSSF